jgi:pyridoxal 5'-phosphate synthase pdxT subunit
MVIGVLALQGAFARHIEACRQLGAAAHEVRVPADLVDVDALILPGGESTTMSKLLESQGLFTPIAERLAAGMAAFGTCAGMILLAGSVLDGRPDQRSFDAIELTVRRNGYGRQVDSFETDLSVGGLVGGSFHAVFIRAPRVESVGAEVDVLARVGDDPVVCRSGRVLVAAFHPELTDDLRLHEHFLSLTGV